MKQYSRMLFLSSVGFDYSRSSTLMPPKENRKVLVKGNIFEQYIQVKQIAKRFDVKTTIFIVMSPSHILVPLLRIAGAKRIILDAGWPLSDSTQLSASFSAAISKIRNFIVDFFAFQISGKIILESPQQVQHVSRIFFVKKSKLECIYTGISNNRFKVTAVRPSSLPQEIQSKNYIFFRGKYNKEAGIMEIMESFLNSNMKYKFVMATNRDLFVTENQNAVIFSNPLTDEELAWLYENSLATVGQFGKSRRLNRTIPHKFFESVWFGVPYLTPRHGPLVELLGLDYPYWCEDIRTIDVIRPYQYTRKLLNKIDSTKLQSDFLQRINSFINLRI